MSRRHEKEKRLKQLSRAIWIYGLSGSGKTTLATALDAQLSSAGFTTALLDGDEVRAGLSRGLGFTEEDRAENLRRAAEVARLFLTAGVIPICAFITPLRANRELARGIIGPSDFIGIYLSASYAKCAARDPKGLYRQADARQLRKFTGRDAVFEPAAPDEGALILDTGEESREICVQRLLEHVVGRLRAAAD